MIMIHDVYHLVLLSFNLYPILITVFGAMPCGEQTQHRPASHWIVPRISAADRGAPGSHQARILGDLRCRKWGFMAGRSMLGEAKHDGDLNLM